MELSVCRAVLQVFEGLPKNGKPQEARGEFTVLAGIAAVNGSSDVNVLSVATGTKCCGQGLHSDKDHLGTIVYDSHAEVLARRAFIRYLNKCMLALERESESPLSESKAGGGENETEKFKEDFLLIEKHDSLGYQLKDGWKLYLYISDSPCGDASIYDYKHSDGHDSNNNTATSGSKESSSSSCFSSSVNIINEPKINNKFTGAKLVKLVSAPTIEEGEREREREREREKDGRIRVKEDQDQKQSSANANANPNAVIPEQDKHEDIQSVGAVRTKSGRSDIAGKHVTTSMSCSDKIARWLQLGLQGALLAPFYPKMVPLHGVIVDADPRAVIGSQEGALRRALLERCPTRLGPSAGPAGCVCACESLRGEEVGLEMSEMSVRSKMSEMSESKSDCSVYCSVCKATDLVDLPALYINVSSGSSSGSSSSGIESKNKSKSRSRSSTTFAAGKCVAETRLAIEASLDSGKSGSGATQGVKRKHEDLGLLVATAGEEKEKNNGKDKMKKIIPCALSLNWVRNVGYGGQPDNVELVPIPIVVDKEVWEKEDREEKKENTGKEEEGENKEREEKEEKEGRERKVQNTTKKIKIRTHKKRKLVLAVGGTVEVTLAQSGVVQGAVKKDIGTLDSCSRLCRREMGLLLSTLTDNTHNNDTDSNGNTGNTDKHDNTDSNANNNGSNGSNGNTNENNKSSSSSFQHRYPWLQNMEGHTYGHYKRAGVTYTRRRALFLQTPPFDRWIVDDDSHKLLFPLGPGGNGYDDAADGGDGNNSAGEINTKT